MTDELKYLIWDTIIPVYFSKGIYEAIQVACSTFGYVVVREYCSACKSTTVALNDNSDPHTCLFCEEPTYSYKEIVGIYASKIKSQFKS